MVHRRRYFLVSHFVFFCSPSPRARSFEIKIRVRGMQQYAENLYIRSYLQYYTLYRRCFSTDRKREKSFIDGVNYSTIAPNYAFSTQFLQPQAIQPSQFLISNYKYTCISRLLLHICVYRPTNSFRTVDIIEIRISFV